MRMLLAPDAFKDALPAMAVAEAMAAGILLADPAAEVTHFPLADGGEGTFEVLQQHFQASIRVIQVQDPLFRPVTARYGLSKDGQTAFLEMAQASGLQLLAPEARNPLITTSFGTGEMIRDALDQGVSQLILGIGGTATNDAGMGMAAALGWRFLDKNGSPVAPIGGNLSRVDTIVPPSRNYRLPVKVQVICDVDNPLFGPSGAAYTYARQKGADTAAIESLDQGLRHFSQVLETTFGKTPAQKKGAGAAGGLGAACLSFLNAELKPGIELVMQLTGFEDLVKKSDWIVTGEGKIDDQTLHGKLIQGISTLARRHGVPVTAFCGTLAASPQAIQALGLAGAFSILNRPCTLAEALPETRDALEMAVFNWYRSIRLGLQSI